MNKSNNVREVWLDLIKGIGILLVVIGHIATNEVRDLIYLFHMPLFFLISGYLYKSNSLKIYFKKKFYQLIIPYFSFLIVLLLPYIFKLSFEMNTNELIQLIFDSLKGGVWLKGWFSVFWFVTCLFIVQQVYNLMFNYLNGYLIHVVILFSCAFAYINMFLFPSLHFFWGANVAFMALLFFYIGHIVSEQGLKKYLFSKKIFLLSIVSCFFSLWLLGIYSVDYKFAIYGPFLVGISVSVLSVLILANIANVLSACRLIRIPISYLGMSSLTIMFLHQPIQISLKYFQFTGLLLLTVLTVIICLICHYLINLFGVTRLAFLGITK